MCNLITREERKIEKDVMLRGGCLITIPKAYRLVRINEKGAALDNQGGHPLSDHGDSTKR